MGCAESFQWLDRSVDWFHLVTNHSYISARSDEPKYPVMI